MKALPSIWSTKVTYDTAQKSSSGIRVFLQVLKCIIFLHDSQLDKHAFQRSGLLILSDCPGINQKQQKQLLLPQQQEQHKSTLIGNEIFILFPREKLE